MLRPAVPMQRFACISFVLGVVGSIDVSRVAHAQQDVGDPLSSRHKTFESPQHFAFELRFSPFEPAIDSDPTLNGATPYKDVFGTSPRLLVGAELDWQALRIPHFGTFGPGIGIGYTAMSANALFAMEHNGTFVSGEKTSLDVFPIDAVAVLRVDVFWRDWGIPLAPYLKAGLGYSLWRASNTAGTSNYEGVSGEGHSIGTHFAVGLGINLNFVDEYAAKSWDESMGVNGTYLFGEYTREDLDGLGVQADPLRVGGAYWTFGLAFEF
jgi:hypothetical protein